MGRTKHPFERPEATRDARLIVIATEGAYNGVEKIYFETLVSKEFYPNSRVHINIISNKHNKSAPEKIFQNLKEFKDKYELSYEDKLYLVIDRDRWKTPMLSDVLTKCNQNGFEMILSNPCFELWILLHFHDLSKISALDMNKYMTNQKINSDNSFLVKKIRENMPYSKSDTKVRPLMDKVQTAVNNAIKIDIHPEHDWPNNLGTRVYLVVEEIMKQ